MTTRRKTNGGNGAERSGIDFSLGGSLGYLVRDANRAFQRLLEKRISPHGVTRGQWYFLRVLWEEDGLSQRELSARVGMMEPTTVIALRGMEKAGLTASLNQAQQRIKSLQGEVDSLRTTVEENQNPTYAGLGGKASEMLRLAEEQAAEVIAEANAHAAQIREWCQTHV